MDYITVLGIDPGIAITGFGVVRKNKEKVEAVDFGVIRTLPSLSLSERLVKLHVELSGIFRRNSVDHVAIEKIFFNENLKSVVNVSEALGIALLTAGEFEKKAFEYTPLEAKKAIFGAGRATKEDITKSIMIILELDVRPEPDDAADALAVALCHIYSLSYLEMTG